LSFAQLGACDESAGTVFDEAAFVQLVQEAGNAEEESDRYRYLVQAQSLMPEGALGEELDTLLEVIDRWANGRDTYWEPGEQEMAGEGGYLAGYFVLRVAPGEGPTVYPPPPRETSPLHPIWSLYRGRMLIWHAIENGFLTDAYYEEGRRRLQDAREAFPENRIIAAYLGEPIPWSPLTERDPSAPEWANLQREAMAKLRAVARFWQEQRQAPDGQFGGGWGDDAEMWRRWEVLLHGQPSPEAQNAQRLFAEGIFALPRLENGYTNLLTDVEHSSEDTGDTITAMLHIDPESELWRDRGRRLVDLMQNEWTGQNERGEVQFRSSYFSSDSVEENPRYACDTAYHQRAMQPALLLWQRGLLADGASLLESWFQSYVAITREPSRGKPAGVLPNALHWPSGEAGGPNEDWYNPGCHYTDRTFAYPRALSMLMRGLVLAHVQSGESDFLEPVRSMTQLRRDALAQPELEPAAGSAPWAGLEARAGIRDALSKMWLLGLAADEEDLLQREGGPYLRALITGEETPVLEALRELDRAFSSNEAMHTSEVRFTDRIFRFHRRYARLWSESSPPDPDARILYEMITGDVGDSGFLPLSGARWDGAGEDLAVWVQTNTTQQLEAELFSFSADPLEVALTLSRLNIGAYRWSLVDADGEEVSSGIFEVQQGARVLPLRVSSRRPLRLRVVTTATE